MGPRIQNVQSRHSVQVVEGRDEQPEGFVAVEVNDTPRPEQPLSQLLSPASNPLPRKSNQSSPENFIVFPHRTYSPHVVGSDLIEYLASTPTVLLAGDALVNHISSLLEGEQNTNHENTKLAPRRQP